MKLRLINEGKKCPNCKKFGLRMVERGSYYGSTYGNTRYIFICSNCFAEYERDDE